MSLQVVSQLCKAYLCVYLCVQKYMLIRRTLKVVSSLLNLMQQAKMLRVLPLFIGIHFK